VVRYAGVELHNAGKLLCVEKGVCKQKVRERSSNVQRPPDEIVDLEV